MLDQINNALRESLGRVFSSLVGFFPGVAALLVSVLLAALLGKLLAALLVAVLTWIKFDRRLERVGLSPVEEWAPNRSPTLLAGRLLFWLVLLFGMLVGLAALDPALMPAMAGRLITYLPNVFVAALLLVAGTVLARFLSAGVLISAVNLQIQQARFISVGVKWMVIVLFAAMALNQLSIGGTILTLAFAILFGGIVLSLSLAVGLASKDVVSRTIERQERRSSEAVESPLQHL